jgi:hypothetical protein
MTAVAPGAEFMGYRQHHSTTAPQHHSVTATPGSFAGPASGPEDALIAALDAPQVAAALAAHAAVLEASLDGLTARLADTKGWGSG